MRKSRKINRFLPDRLLRQIRERRTHMERLEDVWQKIAGHDLAAHSVPASYQDQELTVFVENANWASKLRHQLPDIISRCKKQDGLGSLIKIKIKIEHKTSTAQTKLKSVKKNSKISQASAALILESAKHIEDEVLRESLERLGGKNKDD